MHGSNLWFSLSGKVEERLCEGDTYTAKSVHEIGSAEPTDGVRTVTERVLRANKSLGGRKLRTLHRMVRYTIDLNIGDVFISSACTLVGRRGRATDLTPKASVTSAAVGQSFDRLTYEPEAVLEASSPDKFTTESWKARIDEPTSTLGARSWMMGLEAGTESWWVKCTWSDWHQREMWYTPGPSSSSTVEARQAL